MEAIIINILHYGALIFGIIFVLRFFGLIYAAWQYEGSLQQILHNSQGKNLNYAPHIIKMIGLIIVCAIVIFAVNNQ